MNTDELRERFLSFYEERGHERYDSDSLVPTNDPTLLFTSAGMNQFKDQFQQAGSTDLKRATSCQKCFRTGDIEEVGTTPYHLTFFEMLGNFSFGDYFKAEAIEWGWTFVREELGIEKEKLCVSVYQEDEEAYRIWNQEMGLPETAIYRFGESENFWPANAPSEGPNGPCGPCSEIHYDYGEDTGCGRPDCDPACCDRFSELYNLVFMQYERKEGGTLDPLPQQNIDTGMGLERTAAIMQGKESVFETDIFLPLVERTGALLDTPYDPSSSVASDLNRIADHIRASVFLIGDGVVPSNEGRGYVERKLLRRSVDCAKEMGQEQPLLWKLVDPVVEQMYDTYPDLQEIAENARTLIKSEEETYLQTLATGRRVFRETVENLKDSGNSELPGEKAFELYETHGVSKDRLQELSNQFEIEINWEGFERALEEEQERAREETELSSDVFGGIQAGEAQTEGSISTVPQSEFIGYHKRKKENTVIQRILSSGEHVEEVQEGKEAQIILNKTPFYAEGGGQIGDTGLIKTETGVFEVQDTQKQQNMHIHYGTVKNGRIRKDEKSSAVVNETRRRQIETHHSCTHVMNAILRDVLGSHVQQAGSLVAPDHLRFDFTHPERLRNEEIREIEERVNKRILNDHAVESEHTTIEDARDRGALMFFGDKYGDIVRTVQIGDFSLELCGGTHLDSTGQASVFKITSESSVGSGTRRIEAVCGQPGIERMLDMYYQLDELCDMLSTTPEHLQGRIQNLHNQINDLEKKLEQARQTSKGDLLQDLENKTEQIGNYQVVVDEIDQTHEEQLRSLVDDLVHNRNLDAAFLATGDDNSVKFVLRISDALQSDGFSASDIIQKAANQVNGGGGGRDDFAQAGGSAVENLSTAMETVREHLEKT